MQEPIDPASQPPERRARIPTVDGELAVYEWGSPDAPPLVLVHGFLDHGRGFDRLAPHLAGRYRVVAFDARGHGESAHADEYGWEGDVHDLARVIDWLGGRADVLAHSRGAGIGMDAALSYPKRIRRIVNIDGFGPPPEGWDTPGTERAPEEAGLESAARKELVGYLDRRRAVAHGKRWPAYPDFEALVERRGSQNPRLDRDWLRYFVFHGAVETEGGWTWKADPLCTFGAGPWDPDWIAPTWRFLRTPILAMTGTEPDAWGPAADGMIEHRLDGLAYDRVRVEGTGHFVHMERPREVAEAALDWLRR